MIILISGKKRTGKTSAAQAIQEFIGDKYCALLQFADPIYEMAKQFMSMYKGGESTFDRTGDKDNYEEMFFGKNFRQVMQTLGTEWGRKCIHEDVWALMGVRKADIILSAIPTLPIIFHDVRFPNEVSCMRNAFKQVVHWEVINPNVTLEDAHESENMELPPPDRTLVNSGSLEEWQNIAVTEFRRLYA